MIEQVGDDRLNSMVATITVDQVSGRNFCRRVQAVGAFRSRLGYLTLRRVTEHFRGTCIIESPAVGLAQILEANVGCDHADGKQFPNHLFVAKSGLAVYGRNVVDVLRPFCNQYRSQRLRITQVNLLIAKLTAGWWPGKISLPTERDHALPGRCEQLAEIRAVLAVRPENDSS